MEYGVSVNNKSGIVNSDGQKAKSGMEYGVGVSVK